MDANSRLTTVPAPAPPYVSRMFPHPDGGVAGGWGDPEGGRRSRPFTTLGAIIVGTSV